MRMCTFMRQNIGSNLNISQEVLDKLWYIIYSGLMGYHAEIQNLYIIVIETFDLNYCFKSRLQNSIHNSILKVYYILYMLA